MMFLCMHIDVDATLLMGKIEEGVGAKGKDVDVWKCSKMYGTLMFE